MVYFTTMTSRPKLHISANALRSQRLRALLSQQELAETSGLSLATIKSLEANDSNVQVGTVRSLTRALGCDSSEFSKVVQPQEQVS